VVGGWSPSGPPVAEAGAGRRIARLTLVPTTPSDVRRGLSRRTAMGLAAASAVVASGCTPSGVDRRAKPRPTPAPSPTEDPDVALAATVLTAEQAMLDRVVATVRRHPGLAPGLAALESAHRAHVRLLTDAVPDDARSRATASASASASASPAPSAVPPEVPARPGPALALLAGEEARLSRVDKRTAFAAESGAFARVLASMAAAAAQQAVALNAAAAGATR
jgi:hypothetical protein